MNETFKTLNENIFPEIIQEKTRVIQQLLGLQDSEPITEPKNPLASAKQIGKAYTLQELIDEYEASAKKVYRAIIDGELSEIQKSTLITKLDINQDVKKEILEALPKNQRLDLLEEISNRPNSPLGNSFKASVKKAIPSSSKNIPVNKQETPGVLKSIKKFFSSDKKRPRHDSDDDWDSISPAAKNRKNNQQRPRQNGDSTSPEKTIFNNWTGTKPIRKR
jgi:hypothetical protein